MSAVQVGDQPGRTIRGTALATVVSLCLVLNVSCRQSTSPLHANPSAVSGGPATAVAVREEAPVAPPRADAVRRLTPLRATLVAAQQEYLSHEGATRRGERFAALVNTISKVSEREPPVTEVEVINLLGPPDYWSGGGARTITLSPPRVVRHETYAFLWDYQGEKWVVFIGIDDKGAVARVGHNAASAVNLTRWEPYRLNVAKIEPLTREAKPSDWPPAGSGYLGIAVGSRPSEGEDGGATTWLPGVVVTRVVPGSPAEQAGLRAGDVILKLGQDSLADGSFQFVQQVSDIQPGQEVVLTVQRGGGESVKEEQRVLVKVGTRPAKVPPN